MAVDWGEFITGVSQQAISQALGVNAFATPGSLPTSGAAPGGAPTLVTVNTQTGKVTPCRRRRRRRLLTESDYNDLMRISTLPNKENVKIALAKSIGRR